METVRTITEVLTYLSADQLWPVQPQVLEQGESGRLCLQDDNSQQTQELSLMRYCQVEACAGSLVPARYAADRCYSGVALCVHSVCPGSQRKCAGSGHACTPLLMWWSVSLQTWKYL